MLVFLSLFGWQAHPSVNHAIADADWAGDRQSRKSVSGGMILHGKHLIEAWTKQQCIVASTAEADMYALNRTATDSIGVQARELLVCMRHWIRVQMANLAPTGRGGG